MNVARLNREQQDLLFARAVVELAAALDAVDLLPASTPSIDGLRVFVAAAEAGAFAGAGPHRLPPPPKGPSNPPPPPGFTPDEIAAARKRRPRDTRPTWGRRRGKGKVRFIDLNQVNSNNGGANDAA